MNKPTIRQTIEQTARQAAKQLETICKSKEFLVFTLSLGLTGCAPKMYENVVSCVKNNTIFSIDPSTNERRAIICNKKVDEHPNLQKDLQWFYEGDVIKFAPVDAKSYELDRVYKLEELKAFEYQADSTRKREQEYQEHLLEIKAGIVADTVQNVK